TRTAKAPRRVPRGILVRLLRLPEGEVPLVSLEVALLLGDHLLELRARQPTVLGKARHAEIDVSVRNVREILVDERLDEVDDLRNRVRRPRLEIGPTEPEGVGV